MLKDSDRARSSREFFNAEIKNLDAASRAVMKTTARALKREVSKQLRKFKRGEGSNGTFQKAIKLYDLPPRNALGPASYVRLGVPFIGVFEEGATVTGQPNLIILLPEGAKLGFKRISKGNQWRQVWGRIENKSRLVKVNDGTIVVFEHQGRSLPIYKFQSAPIKLPKKLSFYDTAEKLADTMPSQIEQLLNG
ncbi:MAG: DUF6441 family protein [Xenococcaceae cyanobacterium]